MTASLLSTYAPWVVVPGASETISRATAPELAEQGFSLVQVARQPASRIDAETRDLDFGLLVAFQRVPKAANWAATKALVQTLAKGLAVELKHRGVAVLAPASGPVFSGFGARVGMKVRSGE